MIRSLGLLILFTVVTSLSAQAQVVTPRPKKAGGFKIVLSDDSRKSLPQAMQKEIATYFKAADALLPPKLKEAIGEPVEVNFAKLDDRRTIDPMCFNHVPSDDEFDRQWKRERAIADGKPDPEPKKAEKVEERDQALGRYRGRAFRSRNIIDLNQAFLPEILVGAVASRRYDCGHKSIYGLALATLVHEVSHVYDELNVPAYSDPYEVALRNTCEIYSSDGPRQQWCEQLRRMTRTVSNRPDYVNLTGWHAGVFTQQSENKLWMRSPDPYEFMSIEENFAVNTEFFLTDPEYRCHRPSYFSFFKKHYGFEPFAGQANCQVGTEVHLSGSSLAVDLDPERVLEIHYLLADSGEEMMSRWGHAMFRIVLCSPKRASLGPDCIKDVMNHVVISYRANIADVIIDNIGGMFGKYNSQLFLFSMPEIISEYTMGESRDLKSVPLNLTRDQIRNFVHRVLEQHWEYRGKYYFVGNNCATESKHFLQGALPKEIYYEEDGLFVSPKGLYDSLKKWGLMDDRILTRADAKGRYFYPGYRRQIDEAFTLVRKALREPKDLTLETYVEKPADERRALYARAVAAGLFPKEKVAVQFLYLELKIREHFKEVLKERSARMIQEAEEGKGPKAAQDATDAVFRSLKLAARVQPWLLAHDGYGIPLATERMDAEKLNDFRKQSFATYQEIVAAARQVLGGVYKDADAVSPNILFFTQEVKNVLRERGEVVDSKQ